MSAWTTPQLVVMAQNAGDEAKALIVLSRQGMNVSFHAMFEDRVRWWARKAATAGFAYLEKKERT